MQAIGLWLAAATLAAPGEPRDTTGYWQQEVAYRIVASLDEPTGVLSGTQHVTYTNRSPDTLTDFYFHLYLNAFRPGSRWSDRDSIEGRRRFNDLEDPDYAFERIRRVSIDGTPVEPFYPYAPDSTIVRFWLPTPVPTGGTIEVDLEWQARPSTLPRRQGRRGRRFDFAQWYPRVVVYDRDGWQDHPLYPAGEFYGEFATYDVTLDLAQDQVIGATGVAVEGDPGWDQARADRSTPVDHQRTWYGAEVVSGAGAGCAALRLAAGRKCVRFHARDVHHFAMSLNPDYVYEEGRFGDVVVRVLYNPGDAETWGGGVAVRRTVEALRWLDELFGPYPWPQITNVHRIEGGGTEFPMMVMDGSASLGLILHEVGHNYVMGILANNEWKEGFLDEGFSSFQTAWYFEQQSGNPGAYYGLENAILGIDLDGWAEPISTPGEDFRDFATYGLMTYSKAQLFYYQLRYVVGDDTMRSILREYYQQWKLKHVTADAFRQVAEEVSGQDLRWLFDQWLHDTRLIDYSMGKVRRQRLPNGQWETSVEVKREGDGWMPIEVGTEAGSDGRPMVYARSSGVQERETVTFVTPARPERLMLDPLGRSHDWNFTNNRHKGLISNRGIRYRIDNFFREPAERDRVVSSYAPTVWWNDASDLVIGIRHRTNYLGRFDRSTLEIHRGFGGVESATLPDDVVDFYLELANPVGLQKPGWSQSLAAWAQEGTVGIAFDVDKETRSSFVSPDSRRSGLGVRWVATEQTAFLDPALWENAGTVEANTFTEWDLPSGSTHWKIRYDVSAGAGYRLADPQSSRKYDWTFVGRGAASISVRKRLPLGVVAGVRGYAGGYLGGDPPIRQRAIPLNGADPYQTRRNPLVRAAGAPLVGDEVFYHSPGHANLRGYRPGLAGRWAASANVEIEKDLFRIDGGFLRRASLVGFWDIAAVDTLAVPSFLGNFYRTVQDAGGGARIWFQLGDVTFPLRVEFPFYLSDPFYAHNNRQGSDLVEFRWLVSLQPIF